MMTAQEAERSPTSSESSTVERLAAVPIRPRERPASTAASSPPAPVPARSDERETRINAKISHNGQIISIINVLAKILAVRLYLFFALIGAFVLGLIALDKGSYVALAILIAYGLLTVVPLCILDDRLHRRPEG